MPNVPLTSHPLIGTVQTYRPNLPDVPTGQLGDGVYVVRNGDTVNVLEAYADWNGVPGLTIFYVYVPATQHHTHLSEAEMGLTND